ncbi:hypothetical protein D3C72_2240820 [compost metagenome]
MHKHTAYFGGLIGAAHPSFDALVGATGWALARQDRRQVTSAKADQRVIGVEGGHHQLAHFAFGNRFTCAWAHNFNNDAFVQN